jgi:hypothetical protein
MSANDHTVDGLVSQVRYFQNRCVDKDEEIARLRGAYEMAQRELRWRDERIRAALGLAVFDGVREEKP